MYQMNKVRHNCRQNFEKVEGDDASLGCGRRCQGVFLMYGWTEKHFVRPKIRIRCRVDKTIPRHRLGGLHSALLISIVFNTCIIEAECRNFSPEMSLVRSKHVQFGAMPPPLWGDPHDRST